MDFDKVCLGEDFSDLSLVYRLDKVRVDCISSVFLIISSSFGLLWLFLYTVKGCIVIVDDIAHVGPLDAVLLTNFSDFRACITQALIFRISIILVE